MLKFSFYTLCWLLALSCATIADEIVMVKWIKSPNIEIAFEKHLRKLNPDVKIKYIEGNRNKKALGYKLESFDFSKTRLVYSFGSTATQTVKQFLQGRKPHIFNAVSTPVLSKIVSSNEKPDGRITGVKLLVDIERQVEFLASLKKIKQLAVWYDPREAYTADVLGKIIRIARKHNISVVPFRIIPDADNFDKYLTTASEKSNIMDALYFILSPSFHLNYRKLLSGLSAELLKMGPTKTFVEYGCTIAMGPDVIERGQTLAEIADSILKGKDITTIPVSTVPPSRTVVYINKKGMVATGLNALSLKGLQTVMIDK